MEQGALIHVAVTDPQSIAASELSLMVALRTMGFRPDPSVNGGGIREFREMVNGVAQRRFELVFDSACKVDGEKADVWIARWNDAGWLAENPQHFMAWLKKFTENQQDLAAWMRSHEPFIVFRAPETTESERVAFLPESWVGTEKGDDVLRRAGLMQ